MRGDPSGKLRDQGSQRGRPSKELIQLQPSLAVMTRFEAEVPILAGEQA